MATLPADLLTIQTLNTGDVLTAALMTQVRNNFEFFANPPACSVFASASQALANGGGGTALTANSEFYDNDSMHSTTTNTSRMTIQTAGRYELSTTVEFAAGTGDRLIRFRVNAGTLYDMVWVRAAATPVTILSAQRTLVLAAADYVEVFAQQDSGAALNTTLREFTALWRTR